MATLENKMPMMPSTMKPPLSPDVANWMAHNVLYRNQIWWFFASFIGLVAICQYIAWVGTKAFSSCPSRRGDTEAYVSTRRRQRQWSRLPLACVNYFRVIAFRHTVDVGDSISVTYAEAFMTVGYIVAVFTWTFINTTDVAGSMLNVSYYTSRAGSLAVSQFPMITVLGTKNNILSYITGVSYDKLNYLHRMAARVVLILLWVHGAAKLPFLARVSFDTWFIRVGLTTLVAFTIVGIAAFRPLRARFYEFFFFTHLSMVLLLLIGGYFHANQAARLGVYICPCFLIWGLDRALRLFRIVWFNNHFYAGSKANDGLSASAELLSPQFVRLRVRRPPHLKWTPGQAAFLIAPGVSRIPLEAHPFTIASVDSRYGLAGAGKSGRMAMYLSDDASDSRSVLALGEETAGVLPCWEELEFFINVRDGFTKRLAEVARRGEDVRVWVDGPYGFSPNLKADDTVVLVAGGSGVSLALSMLLGLVSDVQTGKSRCQKAVFIWSIRDPKQLEWISATLQKALELGPPSLEISIRIFVTGRTKLDENRSTDANTMTNTTASGKRMSMSSESTRMGSTETIPVPQPATTSASTLRDLTLKDFPSVRVVPGRPDLSKLLKEEVAAATGDRLSVTVCGSSAIAKSCRDALKLPFGTVLCGGPSVVLHVESFGYA